MQNKSQVNDSSVQVFNHSLFGELRTISTGANQILFNLADICKSLEIGNPSDVKRRLKPNGVQLFDLRRVDSIDGVSISRLGNPMANFIDEPNLYRCIFQSRKQEAEKFQDWVFEEVLPSLRNDGGYIVSRPEETPEEIMARALVVAQKTLDAQRVRAEYEAARALKLESENKALAPKANYTDQVLLSTSTFTFTQVSVDLGLRSVHVLTAILKEEGIIYKQSGQWLPTAKVADKGYFATRSYPYPKSDGTIGTSLSTVITERGRQFLHGLVNGKGGAK